MNHSKIFAPLAFAPGFDLRNRIVMAPMTTWSGNDDGTVSDAEEAYYRHRANEVGLVITGCTHVQPNGIGFTGEFAAYDDRFIPSLKRLADAAKSGGAPAILQIFHAGSKAPPALVSEAVAASAVASAPGPFNEPVTPRELADAEVLAVIEAFGAATRRAIRAGFDGVELHGAHGFLIQTFLSPHSNRRGDRWGGSAEARMRFPLAVAAEVRRVIAAEAGRPFMLGYRISPEEPFEDGLRLAGSLVLVDRLIEAGVDYIHASLSDVLDARPMGAAAGPTISALMVERIAGRVPLIAAGEIRTPEQAERAIAGGLPLVAVGQGLVMNPGWAGLARQGRDDAITLALSASDIERLAVPEKLWSVIKATPGWFKVRTEA